MKVLLELRKSNEWTQEELAQRLKVKQGTISQWEKGERSPSLMAIRNIACLFGVTVSYLLGETRGDGGDTVSADHEKEEVKLSQFGSSDKNTLSRK